MLPVFIAGFLYLLCFEHVDNFRAYRQVDRVTRVTDQFSLSVYEESRRYILSSHCCLLQL